MKDAILRFWFGEPGADVDVARWFKKDPALDAEISSRFGEDLERAARGELDTWTEDATGSLALVVLLDQFSRNVFRGTARAFAQDSRALEVSLAMQSTGLEGALSFLERYVLYMPMIHSEDRDVQRNGVAAFLRLAEEAGAAGASERVVGLLRRAHDFAERHERIVARFGRFPHRNAILGRPSTPEEVAFLAEPGSSFG